MAKDNDLFAPPSAQELDMSAPSADELASLVPAKVAPERIPGIIESLVRGAEQGLTFGFGDEINAALEATLKGGQSDWLDRYRTSRDQSRALFEAGEDAHPLVSFIGNIGGGLIPAALTAGASTAGTAGAIAKNAVSTGIKTGAAYGALSGLGSSEADLTKGEIKDAAKDVGAGTVVGGALGGAIGAAANKYGPALEEYLAKVGGSAKAGAENVVDITPAKPITQAFQQGFDKERLLVGRNSEKKLGQEILEARNAVAQNIDDALVTGNKELDRLYASGDSVDVTDYVKNVVDAIETLENTPSQGASADVRKVKNLLAYWLDKVHGLDDNPEATVLDKLRTAIEEGNIKATPDQLRILKSDLGELGSRADRPLKSGTGRSFVNRLLSPSQHDINASEARAALPEDFKPLKTVINERIKGMDAANANVSKLIEAQKILPDVEVITNADKYSMTGIEMADKLNQFLNTAPKEVTGEIGEKIRELANAKYLQEKINAPGLSKKAFSIADTAKGFTYGAANIAGVTLKGLYNASPEILQDVAKAIGRGVTDSHKKLSTLVAEASTRDRVGRNALMFAIQQNPTYRQILEEVTGGNPNVK